MARRNLILRQFEQKKTLGGLWLANAIRLRFYEGRIGI